MAPGRSFRSRHLLSALALAAAPLAIAAAQGKFSAADARQRRQALGSLEGLPAGLPAALLDDSSFRPLPTPGPQDWLALHGEAGQTFDQFVASRPQRPDAPRRALDLQPIGEFSGAGEAPSLDFLQRFTAAYFGVPAKTLPEIGLRATGARWRSGRDAGRQLLTSDLLRSLRRKVPEDAFGLLAVTMTDLYPSPEWNFVFSQTSPIDRVSLMSFVRFDPSLYGERPANPKMVILRRSCQALVHEAGRLFGLANCVHYLCAMNGVSGTAEMDTRPLHLCPVCLRKLQWSAGFDAAERYRKLRDLCREAGLDEETRWLDGQLERLKPGGAGS